MTRNRWGIAAAAVGIHVCIGSVYAWSVLVKPIMATVGADLQAVQWTFSLAIFFLGMSAAFFGSFVERYGPRVSGLLSTACFTSGLLGTALAVYLGQVWLMYLSYGMIGGIGLGIGYITPVSTLIKWFPHNRGFATGLAIMGFGFAALIAGPAIQFLYEAYGLPLTLTILAILYCLVMLVSALYLKAPQEGDIQVQYALKSQDDIKRQNGKKSATVAKSYGLLTKQYTAYQALKTWQFYGLWWMLFINITCGIGLLSVASPMAQEVVGMTPERAATLVGVIGIANGGGRLLWAAISDYIGRGLTYILFFLLGMTAFWNLAHTTEEIIFEVLVLLIVSCYGGGFSVMPAYLSDLFGVKSLSNIHGKVLTAWAMAGIAGPVLVAFLKGITSGYAVTMMVFGCLLVTGLIMAILLRAKDHGLQA